MSQPAVSHPLARLRYMLQDELFVRSPEGMNPTPRAQRIAEPVRVALRDLRVTLEADEFVAADSSHRLLFVSRTPPRIGLRKRGVEGRDIPTKKCGGRGLLIGSGEHR